MKHTDEGEDQTDTSSDNRETRRPKVLLGLSGSVATVKLEELAEKLAEFAEVRIIATDAAMHFVDPEKPWGSKVHVNKNDWEKWQKVGDPIEHIELRKWADILLIAPLSANTLAKMANGLCDNLLTCVVRAWSPEKPLLVAPAMNTMMWESPFTKQHLDRLESMLDANIIEPVVKTLACGDTGTGAMAHVDDIVDKVRGAIDMFLPECFSPDEESRQIRASSPFKRSRRCRRNTAKK